MDIMPTVLDFAGLGVPALCPEADPRRPGLCTEGFSMRPTMFPSDTSPPWKTAAFSWYPTCMHDIPCVTLLRGGGMLLLLPSLSSHFCVCARGQAVGRLRQRNVSQTHGIHRENQRLQVRCASWRGPLSCFGVRATLRVCPVQVHGVGELQQNICDAAVGPTARP